ncbi:MAG: polysaccharide deacetylase family protein [Rudaea sp.]
MRVPVLTYHAVNIAGNDYATNDHVAFAHDLRLIAAMGWRVVPLTWVVDALLGSNHRDLDKCVALSCDDGSAFDFFDLDHPEHGPQRSLFNCMNDFAAEFGTPSTSNLHLTCFVIASKAARDHIDRECLVGRDWMNDRWWLTALESGRIGIENHSFDHNHDAIPLPGIGSMQRGSFFTVDNKERADAEIGEAARLIDERIHPHRTTLFCYPYGNVSDYLSTEYFPRFGSSHHVRAAFGDGAKPITQTSNRWNLPRYICGWHWKSPEQLEAILHDAA